MTVMPTLIIKLIVLFIINADESDNIGFINTPCAHMINSECCTIHIKGCITIFDRKFFSRSFLSIEINPNEIKDVK